MSCCSSSNGNKCPSRMNDGRAFTDYRPRCMINADMMSELTQINMVSSSYESRMYLQKNADAIMQAQQKNAVDTLLCGPCMRPLKDVSTMHPERYVVRCDAVSCQRHEVNPNGLGDGRKYS